MDTIQLFNKDKDTLLATLPGDTKVEHVSKLMSIFGCREFTRTSEEVTQPVIYRFLNMHKGMQPVFNIYIPMNEVLLATVSDKMEKAIKKSCIVLTMPNHAPNRNQHGV